MTEIKHTKEYDKSPKNLLLVEFVVALAHADVPRIEDLVAKDVRWLPVGSEPVLGSGAVCKAATRYGPAAALTIESVVSQGRTGAVNGVVEFGRKRRAFCWVIEFGGAKGLEVTEITSYSIALP